MTLRFDASDLGLLREEGEVEIETTAGDQGPTHRAIIWVVVDDRERVLIRSYRVQVRAGSARSRHGRRASFTFGSAACPSVPSSLTMTTGLRPAQRACDENTQAMPPCPGCCASTWRRPWSWSLANAQPRPVAERMRSGSITKISRSMVRIM
jgi:hypothetical protein